MVAPSPIPPAQDDAETLARTTLDDSLAEAIRSATQADRGAGRPGDDTTDGTTLDGSATGAPATDGATLHGPATDGATLDGPATGRRATDGATLHGPATGRRATDGPAEGPGFIGGDITTGPRPTPAIPSSLRLLPAEMPPQAGALRPVPTMTLPPLGQAGGPNDPAAAFMAPLPVGTTGSMAPWRPEDDDVLPLHHGRRHRGR